MNSICIEDIKDKKILFVNVSKTYNKCAHKNANCVTLGNWRINIERAKKVDYVMGVCNGEIKSVIAVKDAKQIISDFAENTFPCCDLQDCHRCQEKIYLREVQKNPKNYADDKDYQRLNGRVYFIEDISVNDSSMEKDYLQKQLLTNNGEKFSNYVRYVNI